LYAKLSNIFSS